MRASLMGILVLVLLALPRPGYAQEAVLSGTITDSSGAVVPGVSVSAVHLASGNVFEAVTDERGGYRLAVRTGTYRLTAGLQGFSTLTREGLELLLGQQAVVNFQIAPSTLEESVTVTGESPLIDVTSSTLGSNIDPRQMAEIPVNGRDWASLVVMAAGNRTNAQGNGGQPTPVEERDRRDFQLNVDGQQVTQNMSLGTAGNPLFSRDAIAEFQFLSNRFDATLGRSSGVQVNVVTKAGTNTPSGLFSGYFRHDRFNAEDFITGTVLPYSNQQFSTTFGGPIRRDRIHIFANYEYEREPQTFHFITPWPRFNMSLQATRRQHMGGVRLDFQFSPQTRAMVRANKASEIRPVTAVASAHPSTAGRVDRAMDELFTTVTQVLSNRTLNEIKVGYASHLGDSESIVNWPSHPQASAGITAGTPRITLTGFAIGQSSANWPQHLLQNVWSVRDDLSTSRGGHTLKVGGEYLLFKATTGNCRECNGIVNAQGGPVPANIEDLFPVWNDVSTWNLAALSPITRQYRLTVGQLPTYQTRHTVAAWLQDDWTLSQRLTLNLGVRYDMSTGQFGNDIGLPPFVEAGRPNDTNNVAPRFGFAYTLTDQTVLRGGGGLYYADVINNISSRMASWNQLAGVELPNDGRSDFAANPFNGPLPTKAQAEARYCSTANVPGCLRRSILQIADPNAQVPYSYQASVGVQRQVGPFMAFEADYAYTGSRHDDFNHNINLTYNPATGTNYPFSDISRRAYPDFGILGLEYMALETNLHSLQMAFTKRMSSRWQASATYTLAGYKDRDAQPLSGLQEVSFPVTPDLGGEYSYAENDQRHRAVFNGIWEVGYGFQLSGLYFYGSGARFFTNYGGDLRNTGGANRIDGRLRPDGTIVPRNDFVGRPLHRVDMRLQRRFAFGGRIRLDGILEVFNLFNHENYGSYVTAESNRNYGRPTQNANVVYQPRMFQLGFRATF